jgi:CBS-domain-containing membrane protein
MTSPAITAPGDVSLRDLASLMERKRIKRVPIVDGGKLVGIVSRANLLRAFVAFSPEPVAEAVNDDEIRDRIYSRLRVQHWISPATLNVVVDHGVVELWATVNSEAEHKAIRIAAETTPGVSAVKDHVMVGAIPSGY